MKRQKVIIIGSGFAGLSAACFLAKAGKQVIVLEKNELPGGRARQFCEKGFTFDMGPSWYWMPDVFERFFNQFGKTVNDYYQLKRLDPSYRIYWQNGFDNIPASYKDLEAFFESIEVGSSQHLNKFMEEAAYKYKVGMQKLVHKPGQSIAELMDWEVMKGLLKLDIFTSMKKHVSRHFHHPKLKQLMEFPVLFLGALPENIPALYSLMNYADIKLGTWYPKGGMYSIVDAMYKLASSLGVQFHFGQEVEEIIITNGKAEKVVIGDNMIDAGVVLANADYHFVEKNLLPPKYRSYSEAYWKKKVMAPSCLIYYVGINKRIKNLLHHSLFFDVPFDKHAEQIYKHPSWPDEPLFYMSCTSKTDDKAAPPDCENLFILIPVAAGLVNDSEEVRNKYFDIIIQRIEKHVDEDIRSAIVFKKSYAHADFIKDYNAFKGNAYGLANTLWQTANLKPSIRSKKVSNLYYTGQLTVPGPGVPPCIISGEVVAKEILKVLN